MSVCRHVRFQMSTYSFWRHPRDLLNAPLSILLTPLEAPEDWNDLACEEENHNGIHPDEVVEGRAEVEIDRFQLANVVTDKIAASLDGATA